jgi:hypothetical protein
MFRTEDMGMWIAKGWISDILEVSALRQSVSATTSLYYSLSDTAFLI